MEPPTSKAAPSGPVSRLRGPRKPAQSPLAVAHARFARAALTIYLLTAAIAVALLFGALITGKAHDEEQAREHLLLGNDIRANALAQHLGLMAGEVRRLSLRSELDLRDRDLSPEKALLKLSHERSTFFNLGVAILDGRGAVVWSEPPNFLGKKTFEDAPWFVAMRRTKTIRIEPVDPARPDAVVYVVSPLMGDREMLGAVVGAVDFAHGEPLASQPETSSISVLASRSGDVIYPAAQPSFSSEASWRRLFERRPFDPSTSAITLEGVPRIIAASPVAGSDLVFLTVTRRDELFRHARDRFVTRLVIMLGLAVAPIVVLVFFLRRSLDLFRRSEEDAVRQERLQLLGEAASSIAHEVKNALNGLSVGLDLVVKRDEGPAAERRRERVLVELRREIGRLSDFTTELMTFSKGVEPKRTRVDLTSFLPDVTALLRDTAHELGVEIEIVMPARPVEVEIDPSLFRPVISNLLGNAIDAATSGGDASPRVELRLGAEGGPAELCVRDTGKGVSESMRARLFEPFQSEKPNGVGLGLLLARRIVEAHGGDLTFEGNDVTLAGAADAPRYSGACFLLTLPSTLTGPRTSATSARTMEAT